MSKWIKKGDKVLVMKGNDAGRTGLVLARKGEKILVEGIAMCKKHMKRRSQETRSEIVEMERMIHISNVALCNDEGKKIKVRPSIGKKGEKRLSYLVGGKEQIHREIVKAAK